MKKIELLYFTVAKNCVSTAWHCRAVALFFINCSKLTQRTRTAYFFLSSRWHFSVEQSRFLKKVSSSWDSSSCISSSWPWLLLKYMKKCMLKLLNLFFVVFKMIVIAKLSSFVLRRLWPTDKAKPLASTLAVQTFTTERCSSRNRQTIKRFIWNMRMEVFILTICCSNNTIKHLISNALYNKNDKSLWIIVITDNQWWFLQRKR